jgi:hypothetical protein
MLLVASAAPAATLYSNGFETNTSDWSAGVSRVPTGTNGVTSASGSFHGQAAGNPASSFTQWGGYNYGAGNAVPTAFQEYTTSLDIYLNVGGGFANDTRFDFTSAINNAAGTHKRDFAFNGGFYNDASAPGAGNRFVFSASNSTGRANSFPKNPGRDPIAITASGWYTFQHHFYDNAGVLAVDLSILDATSTLVNTWTLSTLADTIATVGGNRYGWFANNEFSFLAIDNASLNTAAAPVPLPMAAVAGFALIGGLGGVKGLRRFRRAQQD